MAREFLFAFFVAFMFFFMIFFVNQLLLLAENILSKRVPFWDVAQLVVYAVPSIIAMSFPFASLVGALMASGRLSSDVEILVMMASGIPKRRLFAPFLAIGLAISLVSFAVNDVLLPLGAINFGKLYRRLLQTTPALELQPFTVKRYEGLTIVTGAGDGNMITNVTIMDRVEGTKRRIVNAARASVVDAEIGSGILSLELENVYLHVYDPGNPERYEYMTAARMRYNILLRDFTDAVRALGPREMSSSDLKTAIDRKQLSFDQRVRQKEEEYARRMTAVAESYAAAVSRHERAGRNLASLESSIREAENRASAKLMDRELHLFLLEYYKKFSLPFAALCFVFFAFPAGMSTRKSGGAVGFGIGLLVAVLYWCLLFAGQLLGAQMGFSAFWSMWLPNAFILAAGAFAVAFKRIKGW